MTIHYKYIYGIIDEPVRKRLGFNGIEDAEVHTIAVRDIAAVVSDSRLGEIDLTRNSVLAHTLVHDRLLNEFNYTVLPLNFGMIVESEEEVVRLIEANYTIFTGKMAHFRGTIEVNVKIFWRRDVLNLVTGEDPRYNALLNTLASSSPAETQALLAEAERLKGAIFQEWRARTATKIFNRLRDIAIDARLDETMGQNNLLNASFLVIKSREKEFLTSVSEFSAEYGGRIEAEYSNPLPPYSFVNL